MDNEKEEKKEIIGKVLDFIKCFKIVSLRVSSNAANGSSSKRKSILGFFLEILL